MKNENHFLNNLGLYAVFVQKYFWVLGVPYILISPFIWGSFYKQPPPPPVQVMPVMLVDSIGNAKKLSCDKNTGNDLLPLAKKTVVDLTKSFFSWPQNKSETSARMATFSKYFTQNKNNQAQSFLDLQTNKLLIESQYSESSFEITGIAADYDSNSSEYVVVVDGYQTILKNDAKTSKKISIDVYLKKSSENRMKYDDILLEITKIKVKENENK